MTVPPKPEISDKDLKISHVIPPEANKKGIWIIGSVREHAFFAKINVEPAQNPEWELGKSRISGLEVRRLPEWHTVFQWNCGPVKREKDPLGKEQETKALVKFLASGVLTEIGRVNELLGLSQTVNQPTQPTDAAESKRPNPRIRCQSKVVNLPRRIGRN